MKRTHEELVEAVQAIANLDTPIGFMWGSDLLHSRPARHLDDHEDTVRHWGFLYGLAYGIARAEDAFETNEAVAMRAFRAASDVFDKPGLYDADQLRSFESGEAVS